MKTITYFCPRRRIPPAAPVAAAALTLAWATPAWADFGFPPPSNLTTIQGFLRGVVVTLLVEGAIVVWYCRRYELPWPRFLAALVVGNAITLPAIFFVSLLGWFFLAFFGVLVFLVAELTAAGVEGLVYLATRKLNLREALRLALLANAVTAGLGVIDQAVHYQSKPGPPDDGVSVWEEEFVPSDVIDAGEPMAAPMESSSQRPEFNSDSPPGISVSNYQRLQPGMTLSDVEAILGPGSRDYPEDAPWKDVTPGGQAPGKEFYYWWDGQQLIVIGFTDGETDWRSMVMHR